MTEYLTLEELLLLTRKLGAGPVRDPGLLEWAGGNIFKARVYPIAARSEKCSACFPASRMRSTSQSEPRLISTVPP